LPKIGEGLGEWSEASSYGKKRLEMLRSAGLALQKRGVRVMSNPDMYLSLVMTGTCPLSGGVPLEGTGKAKISA